MFTKQAIAEYQVRIREQKKEKNELLMAIVDQDKFNVKSDVLVSYRRKGNSKKHDPSKGCENGTI
jgi:hypothetical protein